MNNTIETTNMICTQTVLEWWWVYPLQCIFIWNWIWNPRWLSLQDTLR